MGITYQINGLGYYRQRVGGWENEPYLFGNQSGDFDHLGCTPTSITNILKWSVIGTKLKAPTPSDTNNKNNIFWDAFFQTGFKDLSNQGNKLENKWYGSKIRIQLCKPPISAKTQAGKSILVAVKQSIRHGFPVLLGISGNGNPRHSIVAAALDTDGNIFVIDPWTTGNLLNKDPSDDNPKDPIASFAPLEQIMVVVGDYGKPYDSFDMAYQAYRIPPSPVPQPSPGPTPRF